MFRRRDCISTVRAVTICSRTQTFCSLTLRHVSATHKPHSGRNATQKDNAQHVWLGGTSKKPNTITSGYILSQSYSTWNGECILCSTWYRSLSGIMYITLLSYLQPEDGLWLTEKSSCVNKGNRFDVHRAVHRNIISVSKPTRCTNVSNLFYFGITLYMFRTVFSSIIRSSRLYIQQQPFVKQILLSAYQQADNSIFLTNGCCCMYSLELLMMDGKTIRNM